MITKPITKQEFMDLMKQYLDQSSDDLLYALDEVMPKLDVHRYDDIYQQLTGNGGILTQIEILASNLEIYTNDALLKEKEYVYFINDQGFPERMHKRDYELRDNEDKMFV